MFLTLCLASLPCFRKHCSFATIEQIAHTIVRCKQEISSAHNCFQSTPEHDCLCMQGAEVKQEEKDKSDTKASKSEDKSDKPAAKDAVKDAKEAEVKEEGDTDMKDAKDDAEGSEKEADKPKEEAKAKEEKQEEVKEKLPEKPFVQLHGKTEMTGNHCCCHIMTCIQHQIQV